MICLRNRMARRTTSICRFVAVVVVLAQAYGKLFLFVGAQNRKLMGGINVAVQVTDGDTQIVFGLN